MCSVAVLRLQVQMTGIQISSARATSLKVIRGAGGRSALKSFMFRVFL